MKRLTLTALFTAFILATTFSLSAQTVTTWIQPRNVTTNQTLLLGQNQVMEVLSLIMDRSTAIDITVGEQTITLGTGGVTEFFPNQVVVAGPATVVMRRPSSGDQASMMTFRVVQIETPATGPRQVSSR
ncbi:MAG: hypothetical protein H0X66_09535 [Verrucomicrobia bacterium]|nr:hypothetical protein [Verrucomicrobiota bacterium]